jgi:signal transduction histidine kinase
MILLTAAMVVVTLATGGFVILKAIEIELVDGSDEAGLAIAEQMEKLAMRDEIPNPLPFLGDPEAVVQMVRDGRVIAQSDYKMGDWAVDLETQSVNTSDVQRVDGLPVPEDGPYRITALGVETATGPATIFVAMPIEDIEETVGTATGVLTLGLAVLVLVLCGVMWVVIGRTLAPVEAIRRQASEITARRLNRRVTEPVQQDEIGRLASTVNLMLDRLEDSADRQQRFVADAAHELRSPVASLRTQLETAEVGPPGDDSAVSVPDLLHETLRIQAMVERLLLLARTDAGDLASQLSTVDLDDTVFEAVSSLVSPRVPLDLSGVAPAQVVGDAYLLEQVVRNLVENAVRHAAHSVRVRLERGLSDVVLTVEDDGPGVPEERREEVFDRFTRLDAARDRHGGGVGLGLAIAAEVVQVHHGRIRVDRSELGGACFRVELPGHDTPEPALTPATESQPTQPVVPVVEAEAGRR